MVFQEKIPAFMILKLVLQLILGTVLSALVSTLAYRFKLLTSDGASAAFLLGAIIYGTGGIGFALPLLFFFFSSSLLSRYKSGQKIKYKDAFEKTGARDKNQVLANGIIAVILSFIHFVFPSPSVYYAYLACLATVNADTWGTEIGILSKVEPISLRTFRKVSPGSSGGVSLIGTASSLFGSFLLVLIGFLPVISPVPFKLELFLIIGMAGFSGSFIDSLLGAFLQAQYLCPICNKSTERKTHCNFDTNRVSGISWLNNDLVNFLSSISGIFLFFLLQKFF
jgi:uncharacterized protein (TIGR00297 family)